MARKTSIDRADDLYELVERIVDEKMASLWTMCPGTVVRVAGSGYGDRLLDVRPSIQMAHLDEEDEDGKVKYVDRSLIRNVPYIHAQSTRTWTGQPSPGDQVMLLWSCKSLSNWKTPSGIRPNTIRRKPVCPGEHGYSYPECIAIGVIRTRFTY